MIVAENVLYCNEAHEPVAIVTGKDSASCVLCKKEYKNIGWFETDGGELAKDIREEKTKADSG